VFQSFNLYNHLTVVENCMLAQTTLLKRSNREAYDKAMKLLESVGLKDQALQYPSQLSGGQKQRAAIARTLSTDPEIILFDEPTSALDPLSVDEVEDVIAQLSKEGRTMMIVTHSMEFANRVSNRVFYMDQGGIYEEGTPEQIFDHPQRELTRKFISHLSSIDMVVEEATHDLDAEIGRIFNFCLAKGIEAKRTKNVCLAYEEYYAMLVHYAFGDDKTVHVGLEYDEKTDKLRLSFTPGSLKEWSQIEEEVMNSLEFKIFAHCLKGSAEAIETCEGMEIRYSYEL